MRREGQVHQAVRHAVEGLGRGDRRLGSTLHFTRPEVTLAMSSHSGTSMFAVMGCAGGTHELALSTTCAPAGPDASSAASTRPFVILLIMRPPS